MLFNKFTLHLQLRFAIVVGTHNSGYTTPYLGTPLCDLHLGTHACDLIVFILLHLYVIFISIHLHMIFILVHLYWIWSYSSWFTCMRSSPPSTSMWSSSWYTSGTPACDLVVFFLVHLHVISSFSSRTLTCDIIKFNTCMWPSMKQMLNSLILCWVQIKCEAYKKFHRLWR